MKIIFFTRQFYLDILSLSEYKSGFEKAQERQGLKIVLVPDGEYGGKITINH